VTSSPIDLAGVRDADLAGTTALVTGSTSGIGRLAALALGELGADVFVHGRDESAGRSVVAELDSRGADARFVRADFADVSAVRDLAATVREETAGLDLLVNNAGAVFREGDLTDLGVERTFHVNHLSPYLLTAELLDHLAPAARVVTTASAAHQGARLDLDGVTRPGERSGFGAYSHSKLANVLFSAELARRLDAAGRDVTANSFHPGAIPGSGFARFLPGPLPRLVQALDRLPGVTSVADGAAELLYVAVSPRAGDLSGRYFADQRPTEPSREARDPMNARDLWVRSAELLGVDEPLAEAADGDDLTDDETVTVADDPHSAPRVESDE
jgi:hypothetical protein